jgi:hypothetical protein
MGEHSKSAKHCGDSSAILGSCAGWLPDVCRHSDPNLSFYRVEARPEVVLDPQIALTLIARK